MVSYTLSSTRPGCRLYGWFKGSVISNRVDEFAALAVTAKQRGPSVSHKGSESFFRSARNLSCYRNTESVRIRTQRGRLIWSLPNLNEFHGRPHPLIVVNFKAVRPVKAERSAVISSMALVVWFSVSN